MSRGKLLHSSLESVVVNFYFSAVIYYFCMC